MNVICPACYTGLLLPPEFESPAVRCRACRQSVPLPVADGDEVDEEFEDEEEESFE